MHGQDVVDIRTERGATTLATGKTGTRLPGQISLLVDLGSNVDIIGPKEARKFMEEAQQYGHALQVMTLSRILYVNGVGS